MSDRPTNARRRNTIANAATPPGLPATFIPIPNALTVTFRRPHSRGPEITGQLLGEVCRGRYFQHWRVQGEGNVIYMVPMSWLAVESLHAAPAARAVMWAKGEVA